MCLALDVIASLSVRNVKECVIGDAHSVYWHLLGELYHSKHCSIMNDICISDVLIQVSGQC